MMRSHTRPWGQCLLCMSAFIPSLSSIQTEKTREPGRGTVMVSGFPKSGVELEAPSMVETWFMCLVASQTGVPPLHLALL